MIKALSVGVDEISEMRDRSLVVNELIGGAFDAKIAEYKAAKADADEAVKTLAGVKGAQAIIDGAAKATSEVADAVEKVKASTLRANDRDAALTLREAALSSAQTVFDAARLKTEADLQKRKEEADARDQAYVAAAQNLQAAQTQQIKDRDAFEAEKSVFNSKLAALKV